MNARFLNLLITVTAAGLLFANQMAVADDQDKNSNQAESATTIEDSNRESDVDQSDQGLPPAKEDTLAQLSDIQASIKEKKQAQIETRRELRQAPEEAQEELQAQLNELQNEIELLEKTFEQIAIGGIDLSVFGVQEQAFNWREELITVVKPLIENLKGLTEKPRKIESLKRVISEKTVARDASLDAIDNIDALLSKAETDTVAKKLDQTKAEWQSTLQDLEREIQLARYQLESLEGKNTPWLELVRDGFYDFINGRGLTIILAIAAAFLTWGLMRGLLVLFRRRSKQSDDRSIKVRYRLAAYGYRLLTAVLVAVAVLIILYARRDLLLLAVMVIVFIGAALALKNLLPRYVLESKLLLNIGSVREKELLMYKGIPWQVASLNMYSHLTNPKLTGAIRLPIGEFHEMVSRPVGKYDWFPSDVGDWVLDNDGNPLEVISQNIEMVSLRDLDGVDRQMPTVDYYQAGYTNLSRSEEFRVTELFGIDYATQNTDPEEIEQAFIDGINKAFKGTPYVDHLQNLNCDFHSAGDSSLNYLMLARFNSKAAKHYNRIKRRIQRSCVQTCNENNWGIPFPQLMVHSATSSKQEENPSST